MITVAILKILQNQTFVLVVPASWEVRAYHFRASILTQESIDTKLFAPLKTLAKTFSGLF